MFRDKREKRETGLYPIELESQLIIRLPEEPGQKLSELIKSGDNLKNKLTIQINDDLRNGQVQLDHWLLQAKIVDLPTIVESWKSIDRKSLYKSADICQMMICKDKFEEVIEDDSLKNKKKDPLKVDKKFLWPHGVTPPTKNIRKRRFRKTLRKKCAEGPELEKEVKRLLRADNEALSFTWEVTGEEEWNAPKSELSMSLPLTSKDKKGTLLDLSSKEEDIFGSAVSDSEGEEENVNVKIESRKLSQHHSKLTDPSGSYLKASRIDRVPKLKCDMYEHNKTKSISIQGSSLHNDDNIHNIAARSLGHPVPMPQGSSNKIQNLVTELEELKQRKHRTQQEILKMENVTLRQRFQDLLITLNKEITLKEMQYNKLRSNL